MLSVQRQQALTRVRILRGLSEVALARLAASCTWRDYDAGTPILTYRDASAGVHFLSSGRARVVIYSSEGKAVVFTDLAAGDVFGEVSAIDGRARSAGVEAVETSTVASLSAADFEQLVLAEPSVGLATMRLMAAEIRRLSERVYEFSTLAVQKRIQAELLRLASIADAAGRVRLSPAPSLSEIAGRVSTHREAVSREITRLSGIGVVHREEGDLVIDDIGLLAKLVNDAKGE